MHQGDCLSTGDCNSRILLLWTSLLVRTHSHPLSPYQQLLMKWGRMGESRALQCILNIGCNEASGSTVGETSGPNSCFGAIPHPLFSRTQPGARCSCR